MLMQCGSMQHLLAVSETNFCIPLCPLKSRDLLFSFCYLHYRTMSRGCHKHSRLLAYYRNTEVLIPLPLCIYHRGNEDRQVAQLLSPRKAKITAKDRGNVCSEFFLNRYRHDGKPKKCQVTEGSMTTFRMKKKKKKSRNWSLSFETRGYGTRNSARIYKLHLRINLLDKFYS